MSIHRYEHAQAHPILMSTFKTLDRFDFKIHEVSHKKCLAVDTMEMVFLFHIYGSHHVSTINIFFSEQIYGSIPALYSSLYKKKMSWSCSV
jgi:hypothetical protein